MRRQKMAPEPTMKTFSFGGCSFSNTSPKRTALSPETKILNVMLTFEEALKLNLAIDECVRRLNSYKRSTKSGKSAGLNLAIHLEAGRVTINEERLPG
jgi:hypothetical protein